MASPADPGEERREVVARARHDLGKYVAFQTRCLDPQAGEAALREALDVDLNATRGAPLAGCAELWSELRPQFVGADVDAADVEAIDADVAVLAAGAAGLAALGLGDLQALALTAIALGDRLRALHRRLLAVAPGETA